MQISETNWKELLRQSTTSAEQINLIHPVNETELKKVIRQYPARINPYYLSLVKQKDDPIWKQCMPSPEELNDAKGLSDPLCEEKDMPVPGLTHRYPDRVLLLVSNKCAMYCRFCTRKRKVGDPFKAIFKEQILKGIEYIKQHPEIRDVLLSGGDPLLLSDDRLDFILKEVRRIPHIEIVRIGTRVPCALPQRITPELCNIFKSHHPLYVNVHFNHPSEITEQSAKACRMLVDSGIVVGNQTVLLKGVNDEHTVMKELVLKLLEIGVRPYYIYQADFVKGTEHFRTKVKDSLSVVDALRMFKAEAATPHFIIDAPGGGGKIPLLPEFSNRDEKEAEYFVLDSNDGEVMIPAGARAILINTENGPDIEPPEMIELLNKVRQQSKAIITINTNTIKEAPEKITKELAESLKKYFPLYINTNFSALEEINELNKAAAGILIDSGIPVNNKIVVKKGYEILPQTIKQLTHELLKARIKPTYIYFDSISNSIKTKRKACINSVKALRGFTSGLAVPHILAKTDNGTEILGPNYTVEMDAQSTILQNYAKKIFEYPEPMDSCGMHAAAGPEKVKTGVMAEQN